MKKIISSKTWLLINLLGTLCFGSVFVYSFYMCMQSVLRKNSLWIIFFILLLFSLLILTLFLVSLNRLSCIIWYDGTHIGRKGLLFGFKYQIHLQEIKDIVIVSVPKQGQYIVIIDNSGNNVEGLSKKSYLRFEYTEKNKEFIKRVCADKNIYIY